MRASASPPRPNLRHSARAANITHARGCSRRCSESAASVRGFIGMAAHGLLLGFGIVTRAFRSTALPAMRTLPSTGPFTVTVFPAAMTSPLTARSTEYVYMRCQWVTTWTPSYV